MAAPEFWKDQEAAQKVLQRRKRVEGDLDLLKRLRGQEDDTRVLVKWLQAGEDVAGELAPALEAFAATIEGAELKKMLGGEHDRANAILTINAGAGGTESQDWAEMLLRMYLRWTEKRGYKRDITDIQPGEEAGIKSATVLVQGEYAYGNLAGETGAHRLVRISPFDSNARRQTSFAAVDVLPEIEGEIEIEIKPDDLERQTFRSGGPGGQHQNKTESGVRYTHLPTGVAAESRTERSQHKNDANAMKLLKAKLYKIEMEKRKAEVERTYDEKGEVSFGRQIRNYTLQPYTLVKDTRTGHESGQVQAILDGDIDDFIQAYLKMKLEQRSKAR